MQGSLATQAECRSGAQRKPPPLQAPSPVLARNTSSDAVIVVNVASSGTGLGSDSESSRSSGGSRGSRSIYKTASLIAGAAKRVASFGVIGKSPARHNMPIPSTGRRRASWNLQSDTSDCPEEFHYASAVVCLLPSASRRIRLFFLLSSLIIAYLQFLVALLLFMGYGNLYMPCSERGHCGGGKWCPPSMLRYDGHSFTSGMCLECDVAPTRCFLNGSAIDASRAWSPAELSAVSAPTFQLTAADVVEMCGACRTMLGDAAFFILSEPPDRSSVHLPHENATWTDTWVTQPFVNVVTMTWRQWVALFLVSMVAALHIGRESRDMVRTLIYLSSQRWRPPIERALGQERRGERGAPSAPRGGHAASWREQPSRAYEDRSSEHSMPSIREDFREESPHEPPRATWKPPTRLCAGGGKTAVTLCAGGGKTAHEMQQEAARDAAKPPRKEEEEGEGEGEGEECSLDEASMMLEEASLAADADLAIALEAEDVFPESPAWPRLSSAAAADQGGGARRIRWQRRRSSAMQRKPTSEIEWEIFRLLLLVVQNFRVLMIGGMVGCLPAFVLYDDVPTLINILLDAIAILFVLEIDNIVYDVVLHEKLKRAIEKQPTQQLREGTRRKVQAADKVPFYVTLLCVNLSILSVRVARPSDVSGSYVVLFCISVMLVLGAAMQTNLLLEDTHEPSFAWREDSPACLRRFLCLCVRDESGTTRRGCLPPRLGRLLLSWVLAVMAALIVILPVLFGLF